MINKKVIICTTIKNESKKLHNFFKIIDSFTHHFEDYHLIFVESNSIDNSLEKINSYLRNRKGNLIKKDFLKVLNRIHKLEICRNEYLDYIKNDAKIKNYDYLIDADGKYCEHVGLNECIYNKYGGLFIDKNLTNSIGINKHTINRYLCSKSNLLSKRFISKFL